MLLQRVKDHTQLPYTILMFAILIEKLYSLFRIWMFQDTLKMIS